MKTYEVGDIYEDWQSLTPMANDSHPDELENTLYVVVDGSGNQVCNGTVVSLARNDQSSYPYFRIPNVSEKKALFWYRLARLPVTQHTPKPSITYQAFCGNAIYGHNMIKSVPLDSWEAKTKELTAQRDALNKELKERRATVALWKRIIAKLPK